MKALQKIALGVAQAAIIGLLAYVVSGVAELKTRVAVLELQHRMRAEAAAELAPAQRWKGAP